MSHVESLLPAFLLGDLPPGELSSVEAHIVSCPRCTAELRALSEAVHAPALGLPDVAPPPALRARLMSSVAALPAPQTLLQKAARVFDLAADEVRRLMQTIADPTGWVPTGLPGIRLFHLTGGPAAAGADCGFVAMDRGARFPLHRHRGDEIGVVVQGSYLDSDGTVVCCGDEVHMAADSSHWYLALSDMLLAVRVHSGIDLLEAPDAQAPGG